MKQNRKYNYWSVLKIAIFTLNLILHEITVQMLITFSMSVVQLKLNDST